MPNSGFVVRWDCLGDFRNSFPAIELPASTDALGIETFDGRAVLLEAFCEDDERSFDVTLQILSDDAERLAKFADKYGDPCSA